MTKIFTLYSEYPCKLCIKMFLTVKLGKVRIPKERHFVWFIGVEVGYSHKWDGVDNVTKTWTLGKDKPGF